MRKFLLLFLSAFLLFASCKKEYVVPNKTIVVNLGPGNWIQLNGGESYSAAINIPELDDYMNERGGVLVYISFGERTYEQIPQVYKGDAFSYITKPGQVVLEVQRFNGTNIVSPPGSMTVKIVLIESNF